MAKRIDPLTIGPYTFDHADYDPEGDTLYLSIGPLGREKVGEDTPEGHALGFDDQGQLVGIEFIGAKWFLERDGKLMITLPVPERVEAPEAVEALIA
jgi:uncharacterized protein YuzE